MPIINRRVQIALVVISLLAAVGLCFGQAVGYQLVDWDDDEQITNNHLVQNFNWRQLPAIFTSFQAGMYQPLATLSFGLEAQLPGNDTATHHAVNLLLHSLNVGLVAWLSWRLWRRLDLAWLAALLFAVWPTQAEVVSWVSARSTLLAGTFSLSSFIFYLNYRQRPQARQLFGLSLAMVAAYLSKASAIGLPLSLLAYELYQRRRLWPSIIALWPAWLLSGCFGLLSIIGRHSVGTATAWYYNPLDSLSLVLYGWAQQLGLALWPFASNPFFTHPPLGLSGLGWSTYLAALLAPLILLWCLLRKQQTFIALYLFFTANVIFSLGIAPFINTVGADRYNYIACLAIIWPLTQLWPKLTWRPWVKTLAGILILLIIASFAYSRSLVWQDSLNLWQDASSRQPSNAIVNNALGEVLIKQQRYPEAWYYISLAQALHSGWAVAENNLGFLYLTAHRPQPAETHLRSALANDPNNPIILYNYGLSLSMLKNPQAALAAFQRARPLATGRYARYQAAIDWSIGSVLLSLGEHQQSCQALKSALAAGHAGDQQTLQTACQPAIK